jgi:uncharacterized delta-60 repeat protein
MRQTQKFLGWLAIISVGFSLFVDAGRAATQLDTTFGENGFISKDFLKGDDEIFALAPQADGKIVVVGQYYNGAVKNLAVARYLPTGELDTEFNNDGIFTESIGTGDTVARSLAIQSDGKIVVAGSTTGGDHNIVVLRLTKDGFQDNAFADNGQLLLPITDGEANAYAVKTTTEGAILVAGTVTKAAAAGTYGIVVQLTGDGQYDKDFGDVGVSLIKYDYDVVLKSIVLQADGEIVTAGSFTTSGIAKAGLLWLDKNGKIDESFGEKGQAIMSLEGSGSIINDVTLDSTGRLLVTGNVNNGSNQETFVGRLKKDGTIDTTFATSGIYHNGSTEESVGQAVTLQADETILVAGFVATTKGKDAYLLTLVENTTPSAAATSSTSDTISATYIAADLAGTDDVGNTLAVLPDGSIFVGGSTVMSGNKDFALLRFIGGEKLATLTSGTTSTGEGIFTAGYTLITKVVTAITRVGAFSGGIITDDGSISCKESCVASCSTSTSTASSTSTTTVTDTTTASTSATTCYDSCYSSCKLPTVTLRGVVYGIKSNPVYSETDTTSTATVEQTAADQTAAAAAATGQETTGSTPTIFPKSGSFVYQIVRSGQTEDGKGTGAYDSDIQEITPNTLYYVRAYAVLSDDTVIYGNEVTFKTNDACFIATAAFGSLLDGHVTILREFRDRVLMVSEVGQQFVGMYYGFSPRVADFISHHETLRTVVRVFLLPLVLLAYFILKTGLVTKLCVLAVIVCASVVISNKTLKRRLQLYEN